MTPYEAVVDVGIGVDQYIAECDDTSNVRDLCPEIGIDAAKAGKGLPNDFELPFDCGAHHVIRQIMIEASAGDDPLRRGFGVPKILGGGDRHRSG
jgi:hypothetical protein